MNTLHDEATLRHLQSAHQFKRTTASFIGTLIDAVSWEDALLRICVWSASGESRYVCISNLHFIVDAAQEAAFRLGMVCKTSVPLPRCETVTA